MCLKFLATKSRYGIPISLIASHGKRLTMVKNGKEILFGMDRKSKANRFIIKFIGYVFLNHSYQLHQNLLAMPGIFSRIQIFRLAPSHCKRWIAMEKQCKKETERTSNINTKKKPIEIHIDKIHEKNGALSGSKEIYLYKGENLNSPFSRLNKKKCERINKNKTTAGRS